MRHIARIALIRLFRSEYRCNDSTLFNIILAINNQSKLYVALELVLLRFASKNTKVTTTPYKMLETIPTSKTTKVAKIDFLHLTPMN